MQSFEIQYNRIIIEGQIQEKNLRLSSKLEKVGRDEE